MTLRFWKDGEKFTERELDSYWNGREEEQDRIIKLLEANFYRFDLSNNGVDYPMGLEQFIERIKGETK